MCSFFWRAPWIFPVCNFPKFAIFPTKAITPLKFCGKWHIPFPLNDWPWPRWLLLALKSACRDATRSTSTVVKTCLGHPRWSLPSEANRWICCKRPCPRKKRNKSINFELGWKKLRTKAFMCPAQHLFWTFNVTVLNSWIFGTSDRI